MDPRLAAMKRAPNSDEPAFYPPGQHPATAKLRAELKMAKGLDLIMEGSNRQLSNLIEYLNDEIAKFEERESERKVRVYQMITRDRKGRR